MTDLPKPVLREGVYYPDPESNIGKVEDGFTATQMREYRNAALEEAAKVCDELAKSVINENFIAVNNRMFFGNAIRNLIGEVK